MVIGAEHDDAAVEAALALVQVVGEVARDVGGLAVGLDDDAVFVVAERRSCAARVAPSASKMWPSSRSRAIGAIDGARVVEVVLVEVHVEVDAEVVEALP